MHSKFFVNQHAYSFVFDRQSVKKLFKKSPGKSALPDGTPAVHLNLSPGKSSQALQNNLEQPFSKLPYYTTQAVRGPITKINQSKCSIAGPIFCKCRTGHCPEWSRTCVFAVFAFFSHVINLLLNKLARDRTGRISALGLFCTDLAALGLYCQDGPRTWLIRYLYCTESIVNLVLWTRLIMWIGCCKEI